MFLQMGSYSTHLSVVSLKIQMAICLCYALTGCSPQPEVSWSGVGSALSALATRDADMW